MMMRLTLFFLFLSILSIIVESGGECDSFYDYICTAKPATRNNNNGEDDAHHMRGFHKPLVIYNDTKQPANSYFKWIKESNDKTIELIMNDLIHPYTACLNAYETNNKGNVNKTYNDDDYKKIPLTIAHYGDIVTLTTLQIQRESLSSTYPIVIELSKRIDTNELCIDISPNERWINRALSLLNNKLKCPSLAPRSITLLKSITAMYDCINFVLACR